MKWFSLILKSPFLVLGALKSILCDPKLLWYVSVPYCVGLATFFGSLYFFLHYRAEFASLLISASSTWVQSVASWGLFVLNFLTASVSALVVTLLLTGFFIEEFVDLLLIRAQLKAGTPFSLPHLITSTLRGLSDSIRRIFYGLAIGLIIFCTAFVPVLVPLSLCLSAFLVGLDIFDLPLALLGYRFKDRWKYALQHFSTTLIFGSLLSLLLFIPLGGLFFLPAMYFMAVNQIQQSRPDACLGKPK